MHQIIWAQFYANLIAMELHPGNKHGLVLTSERLDLIALLADRMLERYRQREQQLCQYSRELSDSAWASPETQ